MVSKILTKRKIDTFHETKLCNKEINDEPIDPQNHHATRGNKRK